MESPWDPDRTLTVRQAREAIRAQFPHVDVGDLELVGAGWEHDAYLSSDGWVFRFPRRAEYANTFSWEQGVLDLVAGRLSPVVVPRIELSGAPGPYFPYPFAGHRHIPGLGADRPDVSLDPGFGRQLGAAMSRIHSIPESEARQRGVRHDPEGAKEWYDDVMESSSSLRGLDSRVDAALAWLRSGVEIPDRYSGPARLIHNDLCPDHILVTPESGHLSGIIDWSDAVLGDPAFDFVALVAWRGWRFCDMVRSAYSLPVDPQFNRRLALLARVLSLGWLVECQQRNGDIGKHVAWVVNAFSSPLIAHIEDE